MEVMQRILKQRPEGIGYLELTMNKRSFAQFAENCFSLSFLVTLFIWQALLRVLATILAD